MYLNHEAVSTLIVLKSWSSKYTECTWIM